VPAQYSHECQLPNQRPILWRYTLQWIITRDDQFALDLFPNNNDATFMDQQLPKPADILLHYNYGAAAVKQWGKNTSVLTNRPDIPRPSVPVPAPMGRIRRNTAIEKRAAAVSQGGQGAGGERNRSEGAAADLEEQDRWDEDDVMLFFWGNSKAALERNAQRSRSAQNTWKIGGLELQETQTLYKCICILQQVSIVVKFAQ
jgi:hypothetical protein